ncbi:MAG: LD-carboxypeptidase, partial [Lentisphaeria bacterium]|nr:LD-carboxypeptidase [Lentisphaeria bacterium]
MKKAVTEPLYNPFPEEIKVLGVPAPASGVDKKRLAEALKTAEHFGLEVKLGNFHTAPPGEKYFSCDVPYRIEEMNTFIHDGQIDMILCARGGYGSAYLLPHLDYEALKKRKHPLMLGGFSDITALHLGLLAKNIPGGIACPMFGHLGDIARHRPTALSMKKSMISFIKMGDLLTNFSPEKTEKLPSGLQWKKMYSLKYSFGKEGRFVPVTAPLVPANLTLLTRLCSTEYFPSLAGKLLLVEDVGEYPRKIDFSFLQLHLTRILEKCAGILLGQYTSCGSPGELASIFRRASEMCGRPFYGFVPFGHGKHTHSLICNEPCRITENGE